MNPIEAMARAHDDEFQLWRVIGPPYGQGWYAQRADGMTIYSPSHSREETMQAVQRICMRAALIAMRDCEVTDAMWNAYCGAIDANVTRETPKRVLRDVINAILEERDV